MYDLWDNIVVGMKVEVENTDYETFTEGIPASFWVATVLRIAGNKREDLICVEPVFKLAVF